MVLGAAVPGTLVGFLLFQTSDINSQQRDEKKRFNGKTKKMKELKNKKPES